MASSRKAHFKGCLRTIQENSVKHHYEINEIKIHKIGCPEIPFDGFQPFP